MHLMALGAFSRAILLHICTESVRVLMHLMALMLQGCRKMPHAIRLPVLQDLNSER